MSKHNAAIRASRNSPYNIDQYHDLHGRERWTGLFSENAVTDDFNRGNTIVGDILVREQSGSLTDPSKTSLASESTLSVPPIFIAAVRHRSNDSDGREQGSVENIEREIEKTNGVLDRAFFSIKKRGLSAGESIVAEQLESKEDVDRGVERWIKSNYRESMQNSPLHLKPVLHGMRKRRGNGVRRPRTRAKSGAKMPYGLVPPGVDIKRPTTTATEVKPNNNDRIYTTQSKLIQKFGVDLWGKYYQDAKRAQKNKKRREKESRRKKFKSKRSKIYGEHKHKSAAKSKRRPKCPSPAQPFMPVLDSRRPMTSQEIGIEPSGFSNSTHHQRSSISSLSSATRSKVLRRARTSHGVISGGSSLSSRGPESVFNLKMAGLHLPNDARRKESDFEKRVRKKRDRQQKVNYKIELQTLQNRVKQLEIVLLEDKLKRESQSTRKKPKRKKKGNYKAKERLMKKKMFVELAPFKKSATSATTAMAAALAAAASAERFDMAASRLEDTLGELGMDDELATTCARAVDRAAKVAGKAINAASTAVSVAASLQNNPHTHEMFTYAGDEERMMSLENYSFLK
jgi:hypothetical protein